MTSLRRSLLVAMACVGASGCFGEDAAKSADAGTEAGGFLDESDIARAAVALDSCLSDDGFLRTQTYLRGHAGGYAYANNAAFVACLAEVDDGCAGVRACYGISAAEQDDVCDTCMDNVAVVCGDGRLRWDCDAVDGSCSAGMCVPRGREICDSRTSSPSACDDEGRPIHCDDLIHRGPSCPSFGLECAPEGGNNGACRGTGAECTPVNGAFAIDYYAGVACDGDALSACLDGRLGEIDCTRFGAGFGCRESSGAFFCGTAGECDPQSFEATCEGTERVFCNAGKLARVD